MLHPAKSLNEWKFNLALLAPTLCPSHHLGIRDIVPRKNFTMKKNIITFFFTAALVLNTLSNASHATTNGVPNSLRNLQVQLETEKSTHDTKFRNLDTRIEVMDRKFETLKDITNIAQKNVDWWIAFLSVFVAGIGIAIPFFMGQKFRAEYRSAVSDARKAANESKHYLTEIAKNHKQSLADTEEIQRRRKELNDIPTKQDVLQPDESVKNAVKAVAQPVIGEVLSDPNSSDRDKLRAAALSYENENKWEEAGELWNTLSFLDSSNPDPLFRYANSLESQARAKSSPEAIQFLQKAIGVTRIALKLNPTYVPALYGLGHFLSKLEQLEESKEKKKQLLEEAVSVFNSAAKFAPTSPFPIVASGNGVKKLANLTDSKAEKILLLNESISLFENAVKVDPKYAYGFTCWGNSLGDLAELIESPDERERLLRQSIENLKKSVTLEPEDVFSTVMLTNKMALLADIVTSRIESKSLIENTISLLRSLILLHPTDQYACIYLANHIGKLGKFAESVEEKIRYFEDAISRLDAVLQSDPTSSFANSSIALLKLWLDEVNKKT